jgi:hypothetical protein
MKFLQKPESRKAEKKRKKDQGTRERSHFQKKVVQADGRCMNPYCNFVYYRDKDYLHAHHVIPRAHGGTDNIENGLSFCPLCHPQYLHPGGFIHPDTGERLSGRQFALMVLRYWMHSSRVNWRWDKAYSWLKRKEKYAEEDG